jgi:hypothetical protein
MLRAREQFADLRATVGVAIARCFGLIRARRMASKLTADQMTAVENCLYEVATEIGLDGLAGMLPEEWHAEAAIAGEIENALERARLRF